MARKEKQVKILRLIDSHIHLDVDIFASTLTEHLLEARRVGITQWIVPSTTLKSIENIFQQSKKHDGYYPAFGLHPYFMAQHAQNDLEELEDYIEKYAPVAIGECGLDLWIEQPQWDKQLALFQAQIKLAKKYQLPLIIHARKSLDLVLKELRKHVGLSGVVHSFSGSEQQAKQLIELGFKLGFGGAVTYKKATRLRSILQTVAAEDYLIETDAPDQPSAFVEPGRLHYPKDLLYIAKEIAVIRGESLDTIAVQTLKNTTQLFGLMTI